MSGESNEQESKQEDDSAQTPPPPDTEEPREIGGREGPDPTRYGDWEKNGRCIDF